MNQQVASGIHYVYNEENRQVISYLNFRDDCDPVNKGDMIIAVTNAGIFDAIVDEVDVDELGGIAIIYLGNPMMEIY